MTRPGDTIGQYHVEAELGEGGFGTVFRAVHSLNGGRVALKILHRRHLDSPPVVDRFLAEAQARTLRGHPHIVEVLDSGRTALGDVFVAMELLEGEPLDERLDREAPLRGDIALDIAVQILEGLGGAHGAGVVHRDLKPANVFLVGAVGTSSPTAKLLDFGVSKFAREAGSPSLTKTGMILGTPLYMAPEQFLAVKEVDGRADLYSASVLFYRMLSGHMPFAAESYEELLIRMNTTSPTPLREVAPWLPGGLRHLIERGLSRDPDGRFRSAAEYIAALRTLSTANTIEILRLGGGTVREQELVPPTPHPVPMGAARAPVPSDATPATRMSSEAAPAAPASPVSPVSPASTGGAAHPASPHPASPTPTPSAMVPPTGSKGLGAAAVVALGIGAAVVAGLAVIGVLSVATSPGTEGAGPDGMQPGAVAPVVAGGSAPGAQVGGAPNQAPPPAPARAVSDPPDPTPTPAPPTPASPAAGPSPESAPSTEPPAVPPVRAAPLGGRARVRYRHFSQSFHADDGRSLAAQVTPGAARCATGSRQEFSIQVMFSGLGVLMTVGASPPHTASPASRCVSDVIEDLAQGMPVQGSGIFFLDVVLDP
ncbi:MAG: protein kinase [Deltaproteobacteria bacterium]|nr:protein kinase [Deltaproteobacteria bacterium]